jgi:hypothetical protein
MRRIRGKEAVKNNEGHPRKKRKVDDDGKDNNKKQEMF